MEKNYLDQLLSITKVGDLKKGFAVDQICTFRDTLLDDIGVFVKSPGRVIHTELRRDVLKKANKDQLCHRTLIRMQRVWRR